ncbi:hypothetical protein [Fibrella forsythiae]|uniref:Uncharacterized protein n=1 Tax=Fibrella forsythiae TaxID=2817061 RepID=A0ABS3JMC3_9BACT|nr:hypothetical protein [Fibrella forsythiae]MBO0951153.1 hypothetical protein [Fibrella forsythiae]
MSYCKFLILLAWLGVISVNVLAQPYVSEQPPGNQTDNVAALGLTILSNPALTLSTVDDYTKGVSIDHTTLRLSVSIGLTWALQVRIADDLRYQNNSIPASAIGIQAINLGSRPEIVLSTADQVIASGLASLPILLGTTFRYRTKGGSAFLKPGGTYTATIIFSSTAL